MHPCAQYTRLNTKSMCTTTFVHMCMYTITCEYKCVYRHFYMDISCTHAHMCICNYTCANMFVHVRINMHMCVHTECAHYVQIMCALYLCPYRRQWLSKWACSKVSVVRKDEFLFSPIWMFRVAKSARNLLWTRKINFQSFRSTETRSRWYLFHTRMSITGLLYLGGHFDFFHCDIYVIENSRRVDKILSYSDRQNVISYEDKRQEITLCYRKLPFSILHFIRNSKMEPKVKPFTITGSKWPLHNDNPELEKRV